MAELRCGDCGTGANVQEFKPRGWWRRRRLCLPCALRRVDPNIPDSVVDGAVEWVRESVARARAGRPPEGPSNTP